MRDHLFGIETEYAMAPDAPAEVASSRDDLARCVLERARQRLPHLGDPGSRGMFVANGGRLYVDCGCHPEFAIPETAHPTDTVRYVLAGDEIVARLGHDLAGGPRVSFFKGNVDYRNPVATWGCHESILTTSSLKTLSGHLLPFLVSRIIYTGAGGFDPVAPGLCFTLSPRVAHLKRVSSSDSTENRGIFHTKKEPLCGGGYGRLHILCGESLRSHTAMWLRTAATVLAVALVDGDVRPGQDVALRDPLGSLRRIATDDTCRTTVPMADGSRKTALEIQRHYLALAERHAGASFMPPWGEDACREWRATLDRIESGTWTVSRRLDWAIKRVMYEDRARRRGFTWASIAQWSAILRALHARVTQAGLEASRITVRTVLDPPDTIRDHVREVEALAVSHGLDWNQLAAFAALRLELFEIDVRFGELGPDTLFAQLDRSGALDHRLPASGHIEDAMENPPPGGRAQVRGNTVRALARDGVRYQCDWQGVLDTGSGRFLDLSDPFAHEARWSDTTAQARDVGVRPATGSGCRRGVPNRPRRQSTWESIVATAGGLGRALVVFSTLLAWRELFLLALYPRRGGEFRAIFARPIGGDIGTAATVLVQAAGALSVATFLAIVLRVRLHWAVLAAMASLLCVTWWWDVCAFPYQSHTFHVRALALLPLAPIPIVCAALAASRLVLRSRRRRWHPRRVVGPSGDLP